MNNFTIENEVIQAKKYLTTIIFDLKNQKITMIYMVTSLPLRMKIKISNWQNNLK